MLLEECPVRPYTGGKKHMINKLKIIRKARKIKVDDISNALEISSAYYYDLEKGLKRLNEDVLNKLADFYNVSTDYLMGRTENENCEVFAGDKVPSELKGYIDSLSMIRDSKLSESEIKDLIQIAMKLKGKN